MRLLFRAYARFAFSIRGFYATLSSASGVVFAVEKRELS